MYSEYSDEDYQIRVSKVMSVGIFHHKTPKWLWSTVQNISKHIPGEDHNLIKKDWDQLYMDRIREEGFLVRTRESRASW